MNDLGDFFSLIGEEKKKKEEKKKEIIGEVSLGDLFTSLSEEKKKIKQKRLKEEETLEKIKKDAKIFESFLFSEAPSTQEKTTKAVGILETELKNLKNTSYKSIDRLMKGICADYNITPQQLHDGFKQKHNLIPDEWIKQQNEEVDTTDWKDNYKPYEIESEDIIKPEPLQPTPGSEKFEEEVEISENIEKSMELLDKLIPEEERINDSETEMSRLKREVDQLRKMVYETVRTATAQGGGGEVRLEFLDDVDRDAAKVNNKVLMYQSSTGKWIGTDAGSGVDLGPLSDIAATDPTTITDGYSLVFDSSSGQFIATSGASGNATSIAGYAITGTPTDEKVLIFNESGSQWEYESPFTIVDLSDGTLDGQQDFGAFE